MSAFEVSTNHIRVRIHAGTREGYGNDLEWVLCPHTESESENAEGRRHSLRAPHDTVRIAALAQLPAGDSERLLTYHDGNKLCSESRWRDYPPVADEAYEPLDYFGAPNAGRVTLDYRNDTTVEGAAL